MTDRHISRDTKNLMIQHLKNKTRTLFPEVVTFIMHFEALGTKNKQYTVNSCYIKEY